MSGISLAESVKVKEWLRFLKGQPAEYRMRCLRAVLRCDGAAVLEKCLNELGWTRCADMIKEVESDAS